MCVIIVGCISALTIGICISFTRKNNKILEQLNQKKVNYQLEKKHKQRLIQDAEILESSLNKLRHTQYDLKCDIKKEESKLFQIRADVLTEKGKLISKAREQANKEIDNIKQQTKSFKDEVQSAANEYIDTLEKSYEAAEASYETRLAQLNNELNQTTASLNALKETRKAAHEALLKQQEIKNQHDFYCLIPSATDLRDIHKLQGIKKELNRPRILSMLIWQSFWQPLAKKQFPLILQDKTRTGIYKITNLKTDECYVGQAVDVYKRFCQHCKAGLGIDTPVGNKLYKAIQEYGLENFAFELLTECEPQDLNDKERYFIDLYQSNLYGYNSTIGVK